MTTEEDKKDKIEKLQSHLNEGKIQEDRSSKIQPISIRSGENQNKGIQQK